MSLWLNVFFAVVMYPVLMFMYFLMRGAGDDSKTYCFGATLSKEIRLDEEVVAITKEYRINMKKSTIILALIPLVCFAIPFFSIAMSIWLVWILVVCFWPMGLFAKANKKIIDLKKRKGWNEEYEVSYTELKAVSIPRKVKLKEFLPAILMSLVPVGISCFLFQEEKLWIMAVMVLLFGMCTVLFWGCAVWCDRQKIAVISYDSDTNMNYARAKKLIWKNLWLSCCWTNTIYTWCMMLFLWKRHLVVEGIILVTIIYGIAVILICMKQLQKLQGVEIFYQDKKTLVDITDDDSNWLWGQVYYNKKDKHGMVENRMGTGTTVNLATATGKSFYIIGALSLLVIPVACIWMILMEMTPLSMKMEKNTIICQHLSVEYEIPLSEITNYNIVEELPELLKITGSAMEHQYIGTFEVYRQGNYEVFANPKNRQFIWVETKDESYYLSGETEEETKAVYDAIKSFK